jgi:hypothetical protein
MKIKNMVLGALLMLAAVGCKQAGTETSTASDTNAPAATTTNATVTTNGPAETTTNTGSSMVSGATSGNNAVAGTSNGTNR